MKKRKIVYLITGVFIVILSLVVWWQFENIKSVYYYFKYSGEDIDTMIQQSDKEVEEYLKNNPEYSVRPSTKVEEKLHQKGIINDDEFVAVIMGQTGIKELFGAEIGLDENEKFIDAQTGEFLPEEKIREMKEEVAVQKQNESDTSSDSMESSERGQTSADEKKSENSSEDSNIEKTAADSKIDTKETGKTGLDKNNNSNKNKFGETEKNTNKDLGNKPDWEPSTDSNKNAGNESKKDANAKPDKEQDITVSESADTSSQDVNSQISYYIAQMYVLKSSFSAQVSALYQEAIGTYSALPKSERNESGKSAVIKEIYPKAIALESSCDKQVAALLSDLENLLVSENMSTEIVSKMRTAYYQEKSLVKAQYLNEI